MTKLLFLTLLTMAVLTGCSDSPTASQPAAPSPPAISIYEAALTGDVDAIKQHIAAGRDLDAPDPNSGATALIIAATFGHTDCVKALIEAGADLNARDNQGSTALLSAAFLCHTEIVKLLLDAGADKTIPNHTGATALQSVEGPFEEVKPVYDMLAEALGPMGLKLDYARLKAERPRVAALLK